MCIGLESSKMDLSYKKTKVNFDLGNDWRTFYLWIKAKDLHWAEEMAWFLKLFIKNGVS